MNGGSAKTSTPYGAIAGLLLVVLGAWGGYRALSGTADAGADARRLRDFTARVGRGVVHQRSGADVLAGGVGDQMHLVSVVPDGMLELTDVLSLAQLRVDDAPVVARPDAGIALPADAGAPLSAILREAEVRLEASPTATGERVVDIEVESSPLAAEPSVEAESESTESTAPSPSASVGTDSPAVAPSASDVGGAGAVSAAEAASAAGAGPQNDDKPFDPEAPVPRVRISYQSSNVAYRSGATWLLGKPAPEISPIAWTEGTHPKLSVAANRGKVFVIYSFQGWCPACQARGFPATKVLEALYQGRDVEFLYLQTPFEAPTINDFARLLVEKVNWQIERTMAQDGHTQGIPTTMRLYRTGGTPWHIVIDRYGIVRYSDFTRSVEFFQRLIDALLEY